MSGTGAVAASLPEATSPAARHERPRRICLRAPSQRAIARDSEAAPGVARWLGDTPRKTVADVLGYEELGREDDVVTTVIQVWEFVR